MTKYLAISLKTVFKEEKFILPYSQSCTSDHHDGEGMMAIGDEAAEHRAHSQKAERR